MEFRRAFLKRLFLLSGFSLFPNSGWSQTKCLTGKDIQGPFYRKKAPERVNLASDYQGRGEHLLVTGTVFGPDCITPLMNAEVDIWHASPNGDYDNHSKDYHFRGQVSTNAQGEYTFETLLPGVYASRPRHIHYKVRHSQHQELTTQLYFEGDRNLLTDITAKRSGGLHRAMPYSKMDTNSYKMNFNIYLNKQ